MKRTKFKYQFFIPILFSVLHAVNPPQSGPFPVGFWDLMESQNIGVSYGDSGWVNKMAQWKNGEFRDAQLEFNLPVLLGKYSGATSYFTAQDFQNLLFDDNSTGTMSDYYDEISHGEFSVDGSAHGWYQSTYTMGEAKSNTRQYVSEIAQLADPDVDFSQFDNDGPDNVPNSGDDDGYVDGIAVVYSGCGAEWSPGNDNLWPHMSSLGSTYEYTTGDASANGGYVIVSSYFVSPELAGGGDCSTDIIRPMGVYAHEFGHILGLPDLYDRDDGNGDSEGIGNWCLMAGGSWNGWAGDTPAHMSAWCKQEMGWVDPVVLDADVTGLSIPDAVNNAYALKIWEDDYQWSRYFLVENRQLTGYDAGLPGSGLMVYHVDENRRYGSHRWSTGPVNDDHLHKLVDVEAADGDADMDNGLNRGDDGDPYPGSANNTDFSSNSNPNSDRYSGESTDIVVTNISSSSSTMYADIALEPRRGIAIVYDHAGMGSGWGYSDPQDSWGGVVFEYPSTEEQNGYLTEVDIGFRYDESSYVLKVYDSFDGTTLGNELYNVSGAITNRGWHSIPIDSVLIQPGQEFFVTHMIEDQSYAISFDKRTAPTGRSYFSGNGTSYSSSIGDSYNINLRAKLHNHVPNLDLSGCTDPYADNYDPDATVDDGSCAGYPDNGHYALSFDGDDYVSVPSNSVYTVGNNYTIEAWINSSSDGLQSLIQGWYGFGFQIYLTNGTIHFVLREPSGNGVGFSSTTQIADGNWHHIAAVLNEDNVSVFVDGALETEGTFDNTVTGNGSDNLSFGHSPWASEYYSGLLDEIRIWNTTRTQSEIQNNMSTELNGNETGLVGYWNFNEGTGSTLTDQTSNDNDGNISGATWSTDVPVSVTFNFDLTNQDVSDSGVHIAGDFQGWDPGATEMIDADGDNIFTYTRIFSGGTQIEYKFINGNSWNDPHDMLDNTSCGEFNRQYTVPYVNVILDPVCMSSCEPCDDNSSNTHSLSFDGVDDYVEITNQSSATSVFEYAFTSTAWVKVTGGSGTNRNILTNAQMSGDGYVLQVTNGNKFSGIIDLQSGWATVWGNTDVELNTWYHFAFSYDGSSLKLYVNGELDGENSNVSGEIIDPVGNSSFFIGARQDLALFFPGIIDEITIWNTTLTQSEIQANMSTELSGNETGLVGYWNFNEGSGTTLTDQTSNDNDGTIYGATWSTDVPFSGTTTTYPLTWSVQAQASLGIYNDNDNYLGVASDATNTFDASYDVLEPPASPGSNVSLYFPHEEWDYLLGDNFSTDARPEVTLTDTMQVWDFEVSSTDAGEATLTFAFTDVPDVPVILENTATGSRETLSNNSTYTFTAVADSAYSFRVSIGDTTSPSLTLGSSCSGPAILISDSTHSLNWTSTDGFEVDSVMVSFSSDSGTTYTLQAALGTVSGYDWTVPDAVVMTGGKLKVKSQDYAGNSVEKVSDYVFAIAGDSLSSSITAGWTLWGAPINPANDTMSANLSDDFSDYWDTFDYMDNGYTYDGILLEGEGYWLGAAQSVTIDVQGTPIASDFTMSLSQGWELISNPLVLDISVDSLTFTKDNETKTHAEAVTAGWVNSIYGYDGAGYTAATTFSPWSGYWMAVLETGVEMTFPIHRHDGSDNSRSRDEDWMIAFDAEVEGANDEMMRIGYAETATDGFDAEHDAVNPPNPPGPVYISLFTSHPEWDYVLGDKFTKDIRAEVPENGYQEWILSMESSESETQISWTFENVPDEYDIGYSINDGVYFEDMRSVSTTTLSVSTEIIVRVGTQVLGIGDEPIPEVFALHQNYPNPFNPTTQIRYDLPEDALVSITIYDIMGRRIKSLVNSNQTAGYRSIRWDGKNNLGEGVSAGMYIYMIQAGKFSQTKKMVLLK